MTIATLLAALALAAPAAPVRTPLGKAIIGARCRGVKRTCMSTSHAEKLAALFRKYGAKWKVDPWLAMSVASCESNLRSSPPRSWYMRCSIKGGIKLCRDAYAGEVGVMQLIPRYAQGAFRKCLGRRWRRKSEIIRPDVNICAGIWLLSHRRSLVATRKRMFMSVGGSRRWARKFIPCGRRQLRFCYKNRALCRKFWWVGSYNWGYHRRFCSGWPASYPTRVLRTYKRLTAKYKPTAPAKATPPPRTAFRYNRLHRIATTWIGVTK